MTKKLRIYLYFILSLSIVGCASPAAVVIEPFDVSRTYQQDYDTTWANLIRFLSANQISIATLEKDSGIVAINTVFLGSDDIQQYCNATASLFRVVDRGAVTGNIFVTDEDGVSTATINISFSYDTVILGDNTSRITSSCDSLGVLEGLILGEL